MTALIELAGLTRTFPSQPPVVALDRVDLQVQEGEYVSVMGTSGSGKSTLLNILGLLDRPTDGRYLLAGRDTTALSEADRCGARGSWLGFVFQAFHLLAARTALENVMLAGLYTNVPTAARLESARRALDLVGLSRRTHATPTTLSGGEQQRVAIARALAHQPRVLLCDEPTGALDSVTTDTVLDLLDELHTRGLTIVCITHDSHVAARAERIVEITDGHLTERTSARSR